MFNKRRSPNPPRKEPATPEPRASETPPRIDLPSFKPAERTPGPAGRPMGRPVAQPIAQPVARPATAPYVTPPIGTPGGGTPRHGAGTPAAAGQSVGRVMLVGPDIRLNAEIRACERLVVEGAVEGELREAERLEIPRGGRFRGAAEVESCVVDGLFEGELTVRGVLALKASGRVSGTVRYGEIEIERGGTIAGNFGTHGAPEGASALRPAGTGAPAGPRSS